MAAPAEKSIKNLSGKWVMNKTLSDDIDAILALQGVSWFLRKAISFATITLTITQYTDPDPPKSTHIDTYQVATGGVGATTELRTLDWTWRPHKDGIFGELQGRSRFIDKAQLEEMEEWLKTGWLEESGGTWVQSWAESESKGWNVDQVWGFEELLGKRYHTRHLIVRKGEEYKMARLVYDYQGEA